MAKRKEQKQTWSIVEGKTGNVHSARYDASKRDLYVRFGYGEDESGVTHTGVYRNVMPELWQWWKETHPETVPNGGFFLEILKHEFERLD